MPQGPSPHARRRPPSLLLICCSVAILFFALHLALQASTPWNDELTYQGAAVDMLTGVRCNPSTITTSLDIPPILPCNPEHPPLVKALIALTTLIFGPSLSSARLVSFILGSATIPLMSFVAWKLTASRRVALLAGVLTAVDPLFYYMSSFAMLDVPEVFFSVAAVALYLSDVRLRQVYRLLAAGAVMGLSILSKEVAVFALGALITYHLLVSGSAGRLRGAAIMLAGAVVTCAVGLQVYDSLFTTFPSFISHAEYILAFGDTLTKDNPPFSVFFASPYIWFVPAYLPRFSPPLDIFVSALVFVWAPVAVVKALGRDRRPYLLSLVWLLWTYIPFVYLYANGRSEYYFYATQVIPPLVLGASLLLTTRRLPTWFSIAYLVPCFSWLLLFFVLGVLSVSFPFLVNFSLPPGPIVLLLPW